MALNTMLIARIDDNLTKDDSITSDIKVPAKELQQAIKEAKTNEGSTYKNIDDFMQDLKS